MNRFSYKIRLGKVQLLLYGKVRINLVYQNRVAEKGMKVTLLT